MFCHICCRKITLPEPPSAVEHSSSIVSEGPRVLPPPGLSFAAVERTTGGVSMEPIYLEKVHHDTSQTAPSLQQLCHITDCTITSTAMSHHRLHHHFNSYVTSQTAPSLQQLCHITDCTITSTAMSHHRLHHHFNSYVTSQTLPSLHITDSSYAYRSLLIYV